MSASGNLCVWNHLNIGSGGTTTLTDQAVKYIKALGYNIKVKQKEIIV